MCACGVCVCDCGVFNVLYMSLQVKTVMQSFWLCSKKVFSLNSSLSSHQYLINHNTVLKYIST